MSLESPLLAPSDRDKMELLEAPSPPPSPSPARSGQQRRGSPSGKTRQQALGAWEGVRPAQLGRGSLFKRLGRDALRCVLPFMDLRSFGALDSAMTNHAEREEPWLPTLGFSEVGIFVLKMLHATTDKVVIYNLLRLNCKPNKGGVWLSCFKWMISKDMALPSELGFPQYLPNCDAALACLDSSTKLDKILRLGIWRSTGLTAAGLKSVERCSGLKSFFLWGENAPKIVMELVQMQWTCFKTLERIDLRWCNADPDCISALALICPVLKEVAISFRPSDADEFVKRVSAIQGLKTLHLGGAEGLSLAGLAHFKGLTNLRSLKIRAFKHTDALLEILATIPSIRQVSLLFGSGLTAAGFEHFKGGLAKLTELEFEHCHNFSDDSLTALSRMTALRRLHIMQHQVTDQGLVRLKEELTSLEDLQTQGQGATKDGSVDLRSQDYVKDSNNSFFGLGSTHLALTYKIKELILENFWGSCYRCNWEFGHDGLITCQFCEKTFCGEEGCYDKKSKNHSKYSVECEGCGGVFCCGACSIIDYTRPHERTFCLDCYQEGKAEWREPADCDCFRCKSELRRSEGVLVCQFCEEIFCGGKGCYDYRSRKSHSPYTIECRGCGGVFCRGACSVTDFSERNERPFCVDCWPGPV